MGMFDGKAKTVRQFLDALPADRRDVADALLAFVRKQMPKGYEESVSLGMITWSVPLSVLPDTYNGQALWYTAFAATKSGFSLYLMSVYGNKEREAAFKAAYKKAGKKLDMGKACLRFKTMDDLALPAVKDAIKAASVKDYVAAYRAIRKTTKAGK